MFISDFSVNHKITILMMTILIIIFGTISFTRLGLDVFPEMSYPVLSIITTYSGASPEEVESVVTSNIEMMLAGVKNVKSIKSQSVENFSIISVEFEWGSDLDAGAQDIRDLLDQLSERLPDSISRPMVMKFDTSQMPIVMYGVTGMENSYQLLKVLEDDIANKLKRFEGVAAVAVWGGDVMEKQIFVDKFKLEQYNISFDEITRAIQMQNLNISGGNVNIKNIEFSVRTLAEFKSINEIENTPIKVNSDGSIIRIRDVADVIQGYKETRNHVRTNRKPTVMMYVTKESGSNTLTVANLVQKEIDKLQNSAQYNLQFHPIMNFGEIIEKTTSDAGSNIIFGSILAIIVMYLFIRNWRPTLAISVAIPVSVVATFIPLHFMGYSLNLMTLAGLALGAGLLIDNAVVVIENIYRHIEGGKDTFTAAIHGTKEVAVAISACTFTTIAVFLPMVFSTGMTSILVRGLALTVSFSLLVSLLVALTIVPALASTLFTGGKTIFKRQVWFEYIRNVYLTILKWCLANRGKTILGVLILIIISLLLVTQAGAEFMPESDNPMVMIRIKLPKGSTLDETDVFIKQIENVLLETPEVESFIVMVGSGDNAQAQSDGANPQSSAEGMIYGRLKNKSNRELSNKEINEKLRKKIPNIANGEISFISNMMSGQNSSPIELKVFGTDLDQLRSLSNEIALVMEKQSDLRDIQQSLGEGNPEVHFRIDRDKAMQYGLTPYQIATNIRTAIQGSIVGVFREKGEEVDIRLQYKPEQRISIDDFKEIRITSPLGINIPLNQVVSPEYGEGHARISREGQARLATITANIHGADVAGATANLQQVLEPLSRNLPIGYRIEFGGAYKDMVEGFVTLTLALLLSLILVYVVMASLFESLKQPFEIMFTFPLCLVGVCFALFITGHTISVPSFVGLIVLSGIILNNGIVLIDYANQLRNQGIEKHEALIKAGYDRLRPVLITSLTTVIAMLPMAISKAEGAEMKNPIAVTIIGGLLSATFFTLVIIPVVYSLVDKISFKK